VRRRSGDRIAAPDQVFGLAWSGAMTDRLAGLILLPEGLSEIYMHPAWALSGGS
jgi:hypothetical protein